MYIHSQPATTSLLLIIMKKRKQTNSLFYIDNIIISLLQLHVSKTILYLFGAYLFVEGWRDATSHSYQHSGLG